MHVFDTTKLRKLLRSGLIAAKLDLTRGFAQHLEAGFRDANAHYGDAHWLRQQYADYLEAEALRLRAELQGDPPDETK